MAPQLNTMVLPEAMNWARDYAAPESSRPDGYESAYDRHTLFYDAIYIKKKRSVCLLCPKLMNFRKLLQEAEIRIDDEVMGIRIRERTVRHDEIWIHSPEPPRELTFSYRDFKLRIPISQPEDEIFRDRRCALLKSKNNDLQWIRDWTQYHVRVHGLNGILFFDNASDRYAIEDIENVLRSVDGLDRFLVLRTDRPYGPLAKVGPLRHRAKFLQEGLLNIGRIRFLSTASSVLSCDLDELVAPIPGSNIFQETERTRLGYRSLDGYWLVTSPDHVGPVRHAHHRYRVQGLDRCARKYCIVPRGPLRWLNWEVHGVAKVRFRRILKGLSRRPEIYFWHCRSLTTYWKPRRRLPLYQSEDVLELDEVAVVAMKDLLG